MKKGKRCLALMVVMVFAIVSFGGSLPVTSVHAAAVKKVKLGNVISVAKAGATYKSTDSTIAYVNEQGKVTGKELGFVTITVKKGAKVTEQQVEVVANAKKKGVDVCADEIAVVNNETIFAQTQPTVTETAETTQSMATTEASTAQAEEYSCYTKLTIQNNSDKTAKKVVFTAKLGKKDITFRFGALKAGKTKTVTVKGKTNVYGQQAVLQKKLVTSNKMIHNYNYKSKNYSLEYGTPDKKAPVISGFVGANSYNGNIPYQIVYSDDKDYDFLKYVSASDDRDSKVKLKVDTSKVDFDKTGTYTITYTAKDKAGNTSKATAKIGIRVATELDSMTKTVLKKLTKESWSDTKKAKAIYNYTRNHIAYSGYSDKSSWENEAANGIRYGKGDCFTYYAVARALLTRAGIPNIEVRRVQGHGKHWWNMVYVQGAFYHFDTCPRVQGGRFCLVTDEQLKEYSSGHGNSHIWAYSKIPKSGTKVLTSVF